MMPDFPIESECRDEDILQVSEDAESDDIEELAEEDD
jgi:hypothetical protein